MKFIVGGFLRIIVMKKKRKVFMGGGSFPLLCWGGEGGFGGVLFPFPLLRSEKKEHIH